MPEHVNMTFYTSCFRSFRL